MMLVRWTKLGRIIYISFIFSKRISVFIRTSTIGPKIVIGLETNVGLVSLNVGLVSLNIGHGIVICGT